jgi:hypothetical protein
MPGNNRLIINSPRFESLKNSAEYLKYLTYFTAEKNEIKNEGIFKKAALTALDNFEQHLNVHYKGKLPDNTYEFLDKARHICEIADVQDSSRKYTKKIYADIYRLATEKFSHRHYHLRLLADIVFIPLGVVTLGSAFAAKIFFTGSYTFLESTTYRQKKLDEFLESARPYGI